jgi:hypothetical protein
VAFQDIYKKQVQLLVRSLPYVAEEDCFALKGGTAILYSAMIQLWISYNLSIHPPKSST